MKKNILIIMAGLLLLSLNVFADDVQIDGSGNIKTGVSNINAELEVTGGSAEGAIRGMTSGTGAAGVYGIRTDNSNYGILGYDNYGVYGNSSSGYAGYFQGNARVTGNLTVDGTFTGNETDPQVGSLTNGMWCTSNGTLVNCTTTAPVTSESDPQVGTLTSGKWCTSDATQVNCTSDAPGATYSAGPGLNLAGTTFNVNVPLNLSGSVASGGILSGINSAGGGYVWGVFGSATDTGNVTNYGGYFRVDSKIGRAVYGYASNTGFGAYNYGGYFESAGDSGIGVKGVGNAYAGYFEGNVYASGNVGIGTTSPTHKLHIAGDNNTMRLEGTLGVYYHGGKLNFGDGNYVYLQEDEDDKLTIYADKRTAIMGGNVGIGTTNPTAKLHVVSNDLGIYSEGLYGIHGKASMVLGYGVWGESTADFGMGGYFTTNGANGNAVYAQATGAGGTGILASGGTGGYAAIFDGNVKIMSKTSGATVVELGEGLDYAEGFDVSNRKDIAAGTVLIIDPDNPGKLAVSDKPYDTRVAGIVAGAKALGSGVRLGSGKFDHDVALAGRVYCNVDATYNEIKPGDLLTTSSTSGYAMAVKDHSRAQGAILGKAMEKLEQGKKGQILVLVTLQ